MLYIPRFSSWRTPLNLTCHLGCQQTHLFLQQHLWWHDTPDTKEFVATCSVGALSKASHCLPAGLFRFFLSRKWTLQCPRSKPTSVAALLPSTTGTERVAPHYIGHFEVDRKINPSLPVHSTFHVSHFKPVSLSDLNPPVLEPHWSHSISRVAQGERHQGGEGTLTSPLLCATSAVLEFSLTDERDMWQHVLDNWVKRSDGEGRLPDRLGKHK